VALRPLWDSGSDGQVTFGARLAFTSCRAKKNVDILKPPQPCNNKKTQKKQNVQNLGPFLKIVHYVWSFCEKMYTVYGPCVKKCTLCMVLW